MANTTTPPLDKLLDGNLKVTIWENDGKSGKRYSVSAVRIYKDANDQWQETPTFARSELLRMARLLEKAYDRIAFQREVNHAEGYTGEEDEA